MQLLCLLEKSQKKRVLKIKGKLKQVLQLFAVFFKIGAFTFGGGYAMIPLIQHEVAENKKWITDDDVLDIVAIAESTPGPIAVNSATFVGYRVCGFWGSFFATLGVILPSFIIILAISAVLNEFGDLKPVKYAFNGIRAGVLALLFKALWSMYKKCPKGAVSYIVIAASFLLTAILEVSVLYVLIGCAVFGIITSLIIDRRSKEK